eukprot:gb/GECH01005883.1/.p1 GENE.gb/GECH01005883.1/~~gb/GECH01005883.1/.p1  ORF type:complete len:239 (+),score=62.72 gb/GECH01005883.1/:1-717(+)
MLRYNTNTISQSKHFVNNHVKQSTSLLSRKQIQERHIHNYNLNYNYYNRRLVSQSSLSIPTNPKITHTTQRVSFNHKPTNSFNLESFRLFSSSRWNLEDKKEDNNTSNRNESRKKDKSSHQKEREDEHDEHESPGYFESEEQRVLGARKSPFVEWFSSGRIWAIFIALLIMFITWILVRAWNDRFSRITESVPSPFYVMDEKDIYLVHYFGYESNRDLDEIITSEEHPESYYFGGRRL